MVWVDDIRRAPADYIWIRTVNRFKMWFKVVYNHDLWYDSYACKSVAHYDLLISMDHEAQDFVADGGNYIEILNYLEEIMPKISKWSEFRIIFRFHTGNETVTEEMKKIIKRNGWEIE